MSQFQVKVFAGGSWWFETIDAGDFRGACDVLLREGLFTSDENGRVWLPPHEIGMVREV